MAYLQMGQRVNISQAQSLAIYHQAVRRWEEKHLRPLERMLGKERAFDIRDNYAYQMWANHLRRMGHEDQAQVAERLAHKRPASVAVMQERML